MESSPSFSPGASAALGIALFLFIPVVLFLFVAHPAPVGASLAAGVALMVGHRFVAGPYFRVVRPVTCAWCHRTFDAEHPGELALELAAGTDATRARLAVLACPRHADPTRRFFAFLDRLRWPLRAGIALPLLLLLGALLATALGRDVPLARATSWFRLVVGVTVHVAALGPFFGAPARLAATAFPVHNFYLLGIRNILWIFRLVGVWWIVLGVRALLLS